MGFRVTHLGFVSHTVLFVVTAVCCAIAALAAAAAWAERWYPPCVAAPPPPPPGSSGGGSGSVGAWPPWNWWLLVAAAALAVHAALHFKTMVTERRATGGRATFLPALPYLGFLAVDTGWQVLGVGTWTARVVATCPSWHAYWWSGPAVLGAWALTSVLWWVVARWLYEYEPDPWPRPARLVPRPPPPPPLSSFAPPRPPPRPPPTVRADVDGPDEFRGDNEAALLVLTLARARAASAGSAGSAASAASRGGARRAAAVTGTGGGGGSVATEGARHWIDVHVVGGGDDDDPRPVHMAAAGRTRCPPTSARRVGPRPPQPVAAVMGNAATVAAAQIWRWRREEEDVGGCGQSVHDPHSPQPTPPLPP